MSNGKHISKNLATCALTVLNMVQTVYLNMQAGIQIPLSVTAEDAVMIS